MTEQVVGAVDLGGSHVTGGLVRDGRLQVESVTHAALDPHGTADELIAAIGSTMAAIDGADVRGWGLAVPGPFDYAAGIARYADVGKFDALRDCDLRAALGAHVVAGPDALRFLNDADAFGMGEWAAGALRGVDRGIAITLGSGIGSAFLDHGVAVVAGPDVPPEAEVHLLAWRDRPVEDTVSRRALRLAYGGSATAGPDVAEIAQRARDGEQRALQVLDEAHRALGQVLAPWVLRFAATDMVVGGSISRSWDVVSPPLAAGLAEGGASPRLVPSADPEASALVGAAVHAEVGDRSS